MKYPDSALLFRFCLSVLNYSSPGSSRVNDQKIGEILGYNPSDCSHWKRGRKEVKSVFALEKLSSELNVDFDLLSDIALGRLDYDEAWNEFKDFSKLQESFNDASSQILSFRTKNLNNIEKVSLNILSKIGDISSPVFLQELLRVFENVFIVLGDVPQVLARLIKIADKNYKIRARKDTQSPYNRSAVVRELVKIIIFSDRKKYGMYDRVEGLEIFEIYDLSAALLMPIHLIEKVMLDIKENEDCVNKLSEYFVVPRSIVNLRMSNMPVLIRNRAVLNREASVSSEMPLA